MESVVRKDIRVLIVDEQALSQSFLKQSLEQAGYRHLYFADRAQLALQLCEQESFDIITISMNLQKDKDGFQLYEELQARRLQPSSTAYLFISADTEPGLVHSVLELKPDDFLVKPYTMQELQQRLDRLIGRRAAVKALFQLAEKDPRAALQDIERLLSNAPSPRLLPNLWRLKGDLLLQTQQNLEAETFFRAVLKTQPAAFAEIGLVTALHRQDKNTDLEPAVERLLQRPETRLFALETKAELAFSQQQPAQAFDYLQIASQLAPRNLYRQQRLLQLSRLNHDYEQQYKTARDLVKYSRSSMYEQPALYLNLARACIDFALSTEPEQTPKLSRQATDALRQLRGQFPQADTQQQEQVVQARLLYMQEQKDKARSLLEQLGSDLIQVDDLEDALDRAKALHEAGLIEQSKRWFDAIATACVEKADPYFSSYIQQERQERAELPAAPRELNNIAVLHYQQGNWQLALNAFEHAFRLLPKNVGIALNLWQSLLTAPAQAQTQRNRRELEQSCWQLIEKVDLSTEQQARVDKLRSQFRR